ncbi:MAG TPA: BBP7 family outer membrane beta-barrel protein [Gemmataceae bacterium]|nr:BBP7 family outer membrane beta-barrel protein [Gemmataceae bacterium]
MIRCRRINNRHTTKILVGAFAWLLLGSSLAYSQAMKAPDEGSTSDLVNLDSPENRVSSTTASVEFRADYLLWWTKNGPTPGPLVTTGSLTDTVPGALGSPHTSVLYGDKGLDYRLQSGGRWTLDWWCGDSKSLGFEASGFILETHTIHFARDSDKAGAPLIGRPFFNIASGLPDAQVVTAPGLAFGGIDVFSDSRLWNGEVNWLFNFFETANIRGDLLAGVHYIGQDESLRISQSSTFLSGSTCFFGSTLLPPDILSLTDRVETRNEFFGGQIGARGTWHSGSFIANLSGKVALGSNHQSVNITGKTQKTTSDGITLTGPGGLLDLGTNNGLRSRDEFTFASEISVNLGYQLTSHISTWVGYTFFYWDDVARPGGQLTSVINPGYLPYSPLYGKLGGPYQPAFSFNGSNFWAQGINLGLSISF